MHANTEHHRYNLLLLLAQCRYAETAQRIFKYSDMQYTTGTEQSKPTCHLSKVKAGWCYSDPMQCTQPSIYLLPDSQHSLQLGRSYS